MIEINEDYFKDETRCDFTIPAIMKRAWAEELTVLDAIIKVCEKHNITYYADFGTLLGAVRHKGFIPWDDDIDITMKRADYNRFFKIAEKELPDNFSVNGPYTNNFNPMPNGCIFSTKHPDISKEYLDAHHGCPYMVGVDIFPLDYVTKNNEEFDTQLNLYLIIYNTAHYYQQLVDEGTIEERLTQIEELCGCTIARNEQIVSSLWMLSDKIASLYKSGESYGLAYFADIVMKGRHTIRDKRWYDTVKTTEFEMTTINIPGEAERILDVVYGDWRTPKKFTSMHEYPVFKYVQLVKNSSWRCKPKFTLEFYLEEKEEPTDYLDNIICHTVQDCDPDDYFEKIAEYNTPYITYNLSPLRKGFLSWYRFNSENTLEVLSDAGALTSILCEQSKNVISVTPSFKKGLASVFRNRFASNLEVIIGKLPDVEFKDKFDHIFMIDDPWNDHGIASDLNAFKERIAFLKNLLTSDGKLILGVNLDAYKLDDAEQLPNILKELGFGFTRLYIPSPNYLLPAKFFEKDFAESLKNDGESFSKGFILECSLADDLSDTRYAMTTYERFPDYRIIRTETPSEIVIRSASKEGLSHLQQMLDIENALVSAGLNLINTEVTENSELVMPYNDVPKLTDHLISAIQNEDFNLLDKYVRIWRGDIIKSSPEAPAEANIVVELAPDAGIDKDDYKPILTTAYLSMIPDNAYVDEDTLYWHNQEWTLENVPADFILFRGFKELYLRHPELKEHMGIDVVLKRYGIVPFVKAYSALERLFLDTIIDKRTNL